MYQFFTKGTYASKRKTGTDTRKYFSHSTNHWWIFKVEQYPFDIIVILRNVYDVSDKIFYEVMGGKFQQNWLHSIQRAKGECGQRINFTFRYFEIFFTGEMHLIAPPKYTTIKHQLVWLGIFRGAIKCISPVVKNVLCIFETNKKTYTSL